MCIRDRPQAVRLALLGLCGWTRYACLASAVASSPSEHVNVFVGTESTGNTFPGATVPHGMTQLSPVLEPPPGMLWHFNSGYHKTKDAKARGRSRALGIAATALSGTGLNDGGDFVLRPCAGRAWLEHDGEVGSPGFYGATFACEDGARARVCLLYTSPSPRDQRGSRMPSSA